MAMAHLLAKLFDGLYPLLPFAAAGLLLTVLIQVRRRDLDRRMTTIRAPGFPWLSLAGLIACGPAWFLIPGAVAAIAQSELVAALSAPDGASITIDGQVPRNAAQIMAALRGMTPLVPPERVLPQSAVRFVVRTASGEITLDAGRTLGDEEDPYLLFNQDYFSIRDRAIDTVAFGVFEGE